MWRRQQSSPRFLGCVPGKYIAEHSLFSVSILSAKLSETIFYTENKQDIRHRHTNLIMTMVHILQGEILLRVSLAIRQLVVNEVALGNQFLVELQVQRDLLPLPRLVCQRQV